jgi:hypothetical protein
MRALVLGAMLALLGLALVGGVKERSADEATSSAASESLGASATAPAATKRDSVALSIAAPSSRAPAVTTASTPGSGSRGAAGPTAPVPAAELGGVRPITLDLMALRKALATVSALAPLADEFVPFTQADSDAALRRGGRSRDGIAVWTFQPGAFVWSPRAGRELWVLSGRSGARALIAVLEPKGEHGLDHAASLVLHEPEVTVALGYSDRYRDQLTWSTCYGCAGEGGTIRSREDGRIEFAYR